MKTLITLTMFLLSFNIVNAQWQPTTNPALYPWCNPLKLLTVGNNFILASQACNVMISSDSCVTWTPRHNGIPPFKTPRDIVFKDSNLFLAVYDTTSCIYFSSNYGNSWSLMNNGFPPQIFINVLSVCGNNIFAGTDNGVYISTDNGNFWSQVNNGLPPNISIFSMTTSGNNIYIGSTSNGIFFSDNNGNNWTNLNAGLPPNLFIYKINITGNNILISTFTNSGYTRNLYLSINNGNSWNLANNGMPANTYVKSFINYGSDIFAGVRDTSGTNVYLTTNNCGLWTDVGVGIQTAGFTESVVGDFVIHGDYIYAIVDSLFPFKRLLSEMVGINEINNNSNIILYPNPTKGKFSITQTSHSHLKSVQIFNILGEIVYNSILRGVLTTTEIDISYVPKGIYFVKLENGEQIHTEKIIIN